MDGIYKTRLKTRADVIKEQLELDEKNRVMRETLKNPIELYPEDPYPNAHLYLEANMHQRRMEQSHKNFISFKEEVLNELVFQTIYAGMVEPILEAQYATEHQKDLAAATVIDFIKENGAENLYNEWKYKSYMLAEVAENITNTYDFLIETSKDKLREGLSEKDVYSIENDKIKNFIYDTKDIIPPDVSKTVMNRVEDAINDFANDNKLNKTKILDIYNKAQDQVSAIDGAPEMKPEEMQQVQQEALRVAKKKERLLTEGKTNVFGAMVKIMTESVMCLPTLQESYTTDAGKIDFPKILGEVKTIYTFMECMNTLGVIDVDSKYLSKTLKGMQESFQKEVDSLPKEYLYFQNDIPSDDRMIDDGDQHIQPKEKLHLKYLEIDNDPSNDFVNMES